MSYTRALVLERHIVGATDGRALQTLILLDALKADIKDPTSLHLDQLEITNLPVTVVIKSVSPLPRLGAGALRARKGKEQNE